MVECVILEKSDAFCLIHCLFWCTSYPVIRIDVSNVWAVYCPIIMDARNVVQHYCKNFPLSA